MISARLTGALAVSLATALLATLSPAQPRTVRIIQTNAASDNVHLIDPATNRVVHVIEAIAIPHGVTSHPDGSALYIRCEVNRTLSVVPAATLKVATLRPDTQAAGRVERRRSERPPR